jgi:hypothetical protein
MLLCVEIFRNVIPPLDEDFLWLLGKWQGSCPNRYVYLPKKICIIFLVMLQVGVFNTFIARLLNPSTTVCIGVETASVGCCTVN